MFCYFSGNFIISSSQNFLSFNKDLFKVLFKVFRKLNSFFFFLLREFCKDWISKGTMPGEYVDDSKFPSQTITIFAWLSKKHMALRYPDGRLCFFCWLIRHFLLSAVFSQSSWEQYLLGLFGFPVSAHNKRLPSSPKIYTTSPLEEDQPLAYLVVVHFTCPRSFPFYVIVQYPLFITYHNLF